MTVDLTRGHAPLPMSSWDFLTLFTLTCSAANLSSQQFDSAPDTCRHNPSQLRSSSQKCRFLQLNNSCNLTHLNLTPRSSYITQMTGSSHHSKCKVKQYTTMFFFSFSLSSTLYILFELQNDPKRSLVLRTFCTLQCGSQMIMRRGC